MKSIGIAGATLVGLCLAGVLGLGSVASAAGAELEFVPGNGKFPVHAVGTGGKFLLEEVGGNVLEYAKTDFLARILNAHLFDLHVEFLESTGPLGSECSNTSSAETILANLLGHLGLADPGDHPAVLLLVPSGFEYTCSALGGFIKEKVKLKGQLIGEIPNKLLEQLRCTTFKFEQSKGKQKFTEFLLSGFANELMTGQREQIKIGEGAEEESGQEGEVALTVLGGGTLEIRD
jgi:hypothetical protein